MRLCRIALASVNTTVGAFASNVDRAIARAKEAVKDHATVVLFPEQLVSGYSPEDLVQWGAFVERQWTELTRFAKETARLDAHFVVGVTIADGAMVYNCAAFVSGGEILGLVPKEKLPTYNVFYEGRTFAHGTAGALRATHGVPFGDLVFDCDFGTLALEVCEDLWSPDGPMRRRCYAGAELVCNLSASPYRIGVEETRREMLTTRAGDNQATVAYVNLVGANDGLVFDGGGFVAQNGRLVHSAPRFREGVTAVTVDLDRTRRLRLENTTHRNDVEAYGLGEHTVHHVHVARSIASRKKLKFPAPASFFLPPPERAQVAARALFCEEILDALALGVGDYFEKVGAWKTIGVALSGGRDSLLVLLIAARYLARAKKPKNLLRAFYLPSRYSSKETRAAAVAAAKDVGAPLVIESIDDAFVRELAAVEQMLQPGEKLTQMARQNIQARIRAERMWTWSNAAAGLFLQTSNMSEKAVGYSTIGGDSEGALAVIANLPKTVVNYILDYLYETTKSEGIRLTLKKAASAELAENQEDERDLMPFPILDACFALYAGEKMAPDEVELALREMFSDVSHNQLREYVEKFARLFTQSIYKWVQAPLSLHIGNLDLDRERALQLPVVQKNDWQRR